MVSIVLSILASEFFNRAYNSEYIHVLSDDNYETSPTPPPAMSPISQDE